MIAFDIMMLFQLFKHNFAGFLDVVSSSIEIPLILLFFLYDLSFPSFISLLNIIFSSVSMDIIG
jgi:hypothetical protein